MPRPRGWSEIKISRFCGNRERDQRNQLKPNSSDLMRKALAGGSLLPWIHSLSNHGGRRQMERGMWRWSSSLPSCWTHIGPGRVSLLCACAVDESSSIQGYSGGQRGSLCPPSVPCPWNVLTCSKWLPEGLVAGRTDVSWVGLDDLQAPWEL